MRRHTSTVSHCRTGEAAKIVSVVPECDTGLGLLWLAAQCIAFAQGARGYILPWALLSAGTVHITNNMAKDVNKAMQGWDSWFDGFKCIHYLLHKDHLRQRLVGRLVLGTRFEQAQRLFNLQCPFYATW